MNPGGLPWGEIFRASVLLQRRHPLWYYSSAAFQSSVPSENTSPSDLMAKQINDREDSP